MSGKIVGRSDLIALGHAGNNRLLRRLHDLRYLADSDYPSGEARASSRSTTPLAMAGTFWPCWAARARCARGAEAVARGGNGAGWALARGRPPADPGAQAEDPRIWTRCCVPAARSGARSCRPSAFLQALNCLNATGESGGRVPSSSWSPPTPRGEILPLPSGGCPPWTSGPTHSRQHGIAPRSSVFSDEERLLVANFLASCTVLSRPHLPEMAAGPDRSTRCSTTTFPAIRALLWHALPAAAWLPARHPRRVGGKALAILRARQADAPSTRAEPGTLAGWQPLLLVDAWPRATRSYVRSD